MQNHKRPPEEDNPRYDQFSKKIRLDSDQGTQFQDVTDRNNSNRMVKVDIPIASTQSYSIQEHSNITYLNASTPISQALQFVSGGPVNDSRASRLLKNVVLEKLHVEQNSGQTNSSCQDGNQCQQRITQGQKPYKLQNDVLLQRVSNTQNGPQDGSALQYGIQQGTNIQVHVPTESEQQNKYILNEINTQHVRHSYGSLEGQGGTLQVELPTSSSQVERPITTLQVGQHQFGTVQVQQPKGTLQVQHQTGTLQIERQESEQLSSVAEQQNSEIQNCETLQTNNLQENVVSLGNGVNVTNIAIPTGILKAPLTLPVSVATPISGANVVYVRPATDGSGATIVQQRLLTPTKKTGNGGISSQAEMIQKLSLLKPAAINSSSQTQSLINSGGIIRQVYYVSATNAKNPPVVNSPKKEKPSPNIMPGTNISYKTPGANYRNRNGNIKRPMNAFMLWARNYRRHLSQSMPAATNAEISVRLGQVWGSLPAEEKQEFYREAEKIKMQHHRDFPGWVYKPNQTKKEVDTQHERLWAKYGNSSGTTHTVVVSPNPKVSLKTTVATPNSRSSSSQTDISITYPKSSSPYLFNKDTATKSQTIEVHNDPVVVDVKSLKQFDDCSADIQQIGGVRSDASNKSDKQTADVVTVTQKLPSISSLLKKSSNLLNAENSHEEIREKPVKTIDHYVIEQTPTVQRNPVADLKSIYISPIKPNASAEEDTSNSIRQKENSQDKTPLAKTTTRRGRPPSVTRRVEDPFPKEAYQPKNKKATKDANKQAKNRLSSSKKISKSKSDKDDNKLVTTEDKTEQKVSPLKESDFHRKATPIKSKIVKNNAQNESPSIPSTTADKSVSKAEACGVMPSTADDTNTELWPFPFPTIDHNAHEILFDDDLREDRDTDREYMDPYHPFYYHGNYDSSDSKDVSSFQLDVSGWQRYLNDSKVMSDSSKTNLNYFAPIIKCEKDEGVEKSQSDLDICPTPVSVTLQRRNNQLPCASTHSPQDDTEQQESSIGVTRQPGIQQTVEFGTSVQDFDSNYQTQGLRHHGTDYQGIESQVFTDTQNQKETSEFVRSFTSAINVLENSDTDCSGSFQLNKEHESNQNTSATSESSDQMKNNPYGVSPKGKSEDSRPLKKRTDRFMRDFLTEVTNGVETNSVSCKKDDTANNCAGSYVETLLLGNQCGANVKPGSKSATVGPVDYENSTISSISVLDHDANRIGEDTKLKTEPPAQATDVDMIIISPLADNSEKSSVKDAFGKISDIVSMTRQALDAISTTTINTMKNLNA